MSKTSHEWLRKYSMFKSLKTVNKLVLEEALDFMGESPESIVFWVKSSDLELVDRGDGVGGGSEWWQVDKGYQSGFSRRGWYDSPLINETLAESRYLFNRARPVCPTRAWRKCTLAWRIKLGISCTKGFPRASKQCNSDLQRSHDSGKPRVQQILLL